jgi:hypothetical protein
MAKPSRTHSFTALVNHTAQVPSARQPPRYGVDREAQARGCGYDSQSSAANFITKQTAEEGKAVAQGMIAFYSTYTVNEGDKTLTTRIEGSSYPNLIGGEQKRVITSLTADELRYQHLLANRPQGLPKRAESS